MWRDGDVNWSVAIRRDIRKARHCARLRLLLRLRAWPAVELEQVQQVICAIVRSSCWAGVWCWIGGTKDVRRVLRIESVRRQRNEGRWRCWLLVWWRCSWRWRWRWLFVALLLEARKQLAEVGHFFESWRRRALLLILRRSQDGVWFEVRCKGVEWLAVCLQFDGVFGCVREVASQAQSWSEA